MFNPTKQRLPSIKTLLETTPPFNEYKPIHDPSNSTDSYDSLYHVHISPLNSSSFHSNYNFSSKNDSFSHHNSFSDHGKFSLISPPSSPEASSITDCSFATSPTSSFSFSPPISVSHSASQDNLNSNPHSNPHPHPHLSYHQHHQNYQNHQITFPSSSSSPYTTYSPRSPHLHSHSIPQHCQSSNPYNYPLNSHPSSSHFSHSSHSSHSPPSILSPTDSISSNRYQCPYCPKRFSRPSSLRIHTFSHTGEKPFSCPVNGCGRTFSVQSNMRRHLRVHRGHTE